MSGTPNPDRKLLAEILADHEETRLGGCICGWSDPRQSNARSRTAFPDHLAETLLRNGAVITRAPKIDRRPVNEFGLSPRLVRRISDEVTCRAVHLSAENAVWVARWMSHQQIPARRTVGRETEGIRLVSGNRARHLLFGLARYGDWILNWGYSEFSVLSDEDFRERFKAD